MVIKKTSNLVGIIDVGVNECDIQEDFSFRSSTEFRKTAENVLKLILLMIESGLVERKCVILLLCCVIW